MSKVHSQQEQQQLTTTQVTTHSAPQATTTQVQHVGGPQATTRQGHYSGSHIGHHTEPPPPYPGLPDSVTYQPTQTGYNPPVFKELPIRTNCISCQADIVTSIHYEAGLFTYGSCAITIFFGLWCGCCLIPFCVNECQDCVHTCPNCGVTVGRYNRV